MNYSRLLRVLLAVVAVTSIVLFLLVKPLVWLLVVFIASLSLVIWNRPWLGKPEDREAAVNDIAARYIKVLRLLATTGGKLTQRQVQAQTTDIAFAGAVEPFILRCRGKNEQRPLTKYERLTLVTGLSGKRNSAVRDEIRRAVDAFYCSLKRDERNQVLTLVRAGKS